MFISCDSLLIWLIILMALYICVYYVNPSDGIIIKGESKNVKAIDW